jgi:hypothetical protein
VSRGIEIIEHRDLPEGWIQIRCAVRGKLAVPFQLHKSDLEQYRDEDSYLAMLERQAVSLIETYGDARCQRLEEVA